MAGPLSYFAILDAQAHFETLIHTALTRRKAHQQGLFATNPKD
jgi:hypothetical protein